MTEPITTFKPGEDIICVSNQGYCNLTIGKTYTCLYGTEEGIFASHPYVSVKDDVGRKATTYDWRFKKKE